VIVCSSGERVSDNGVSSGDWEVRLSGARLVDGVHSALHLHHGWLALSLGAPNSVNFLPLPLLRRQPLSVPFDVQSGSVKFRCALTLVDVQCIQCSDFLAGYQHRVAWCNKNGTKIF
jgi:hypothetical protein